MMLRKLVVAFVLLAAGMARAEDPQANSCLVDVAPSAGEAMYLDITLRCATGSVLTLRANSQQSASFVAKVTDAAGREVERNERSWRLPADDSGVVTARYRFELDAYLDETNNDRDGMRRGATRAALLGGWMLQPVATGADLALSIAVALPPGQNFAAGLSREGERYTIGIGTRFGGYTVFGTFEPIVVTVPPPPGEDNAAIALVLLDANYTATREQYAEWLRLSARALANYFDGFAATKALVVAFPARGKGVQFGRVMAGGGITIALRLGVDEQARDLYRAWVLIHEMIHTVMPFVLGRGTWMMEGAATYLEPIISHRAGWKGEDDVWREWITNMPLGLSALTEVGLGANTAHQGYYWGGAIFMLLTDIEIRRASGNRLGLEDCLRYILRGGGNSTTVLSVDRMISACDQAVGGTAMQELAKLYVYKPTPLDLATLWRELGVALVDGKVVYDDSAPLATIRKVIVRGTRPPKLVPMGPG